MPSQGGLVLLELHLLQSLLLNVFLGCLQLGLQQVNVRIKLGSLTLEFLVFSGKGFAVAGKLRDGVLGLAAV